MSCLLLLSSFFFPLHQRFDICVFVWLSGCLVVRVSVHPSVCPSISSFGGVYRVFKQNNPRIVVHQVFWQINCSYTHRHLGSYPCSARQERRERRERRHKYDEVINIFFFFLNTKKNLFFLFTMYRLPPVSPLCPTHRTHSLPIAAITTGRGGASTAGRVRTSSSL